MTPKTLDNYFNLSLKCFVLYGLSSTSKPVMKFISKFILYPIMITFYAMVLFNVRYKHSNIFEIAEVSISATTFGNIFIRKTILVFNGPLIEDLIENQIHFWKYELFGKIWATKYHENMKFCKKLIEAIMIGAGISIVVHSSLPVFIKALPLPQACWIPGNDPTARVIIYAVEILVYIECLILMEIFDGIYLLSTVNLKIQFSLLQRAVESLNLDKDDEEMSWNTLKVCCRYHTFLLSMHKRVNKIYSTFFLYQYLLTVWGTCTTLFVIYNKDSNFAQILESVFIGSIINTLLIYIFIPASEVDIEAEKLISKIYEIDWYNAKSTRIRKFILFWLMQAQVPVQMTGAGMLTITRAQMLQIQRIGYSISTLLSGLS